jgi:predicted benzoate:H+ symporter BenE
MRNSVKIALSVALMTMVAQFSFGMAVLADDHNRHRCGIAITTDIVTTGSMALQARSPARAYRF